MSFFDSHAHIGAPELLAEAEAILMRARAAGVSGVLAVGAGYGIGANAGAVAVAEQHPDVWATVGVHPHDASEWNELAERALERDPQLAGLQAYAEDSGEGRWTVLEAVERDVPATAIAHSLFARFDSRHDALLPDRDLLGHREVVSDEDGRFHLSRAAMPGLSAWPMIRT